MLETPLSAADNAAAGVSHGQQHRRNSLSSPSCSASGTSPLDLDFLETSAQQTGAATTTVQPASGASMATVQLLPAVQLSLKYWVQAHGHAYAVLNSQRHQ